MTNPVFSFLIHFFIIFLLLVLRFISFFNIFNKFEFFFTFFQIFCFALFQFLINFLCYWYLQYFSHFYTFFDHISHFYLFFNIVKLFQKLYKNHIKNEHWTDNKQEFVYPPRSPIVPEQNNLNTASTSIKDEQQLNYITYEDTSTMHSAVKTLNFAYANFFYKFSTR